jgi:hypothetical protein
METVARDQNYGHFLLKFWWVVHKQNTAEHMHSFLYLGFITKIILVFYNTCVWLNVASSPALSGSSLFQILAGRSAIFTPSFCDFSQFLHVSGGVITDSSSQNCTIAQSR